MAEQKHTYQLTSEERDRRARVLADEMRDAILKYGDKETFFLDIDTPLSVVVQALNIFYGDDLTICLELQDIDLFTDRPNIYLREAPFNMQKTPDSA